VDAYDASHENTSRGAVPGDLPSDEVRSLLPVVNAFDPDENLVIPLRMFASLVTHKYTFLHS